LQDETAGVSTPDKQAQLWRYAWICVVTCTLIYLFREVGAWRGWWKGENLSLWITWGLDPMNASGFLSIFVAFQLASSFDVRTRGLWVLAGLLVEFFVFLNRPFTWDFQSRLAAVGLGFGVTGVIGLGWQAHAFPRVRTYRFLLLIATFLFLYPRDVDLCHSLLANWTPQVFDPTGIVIDRLWGREPVVDLTNWLQTTGGLFPLRLIYVELPLCLCLAIYWNYTAAERSSFNFLKAFLLSTGLGFLCYAILPMVGPLVFYSHIPWRESWNECSTNLSLPLSRGCMPSLHATWGWLIFRAFADLGPRGWKLGGLFCLFTSVSIFPVGGHYLIDIVPALPLATLVWALSSWHPRWKLAAGALAALFGWVLAFRLCPLWLCQQAHLTRGLQIATLLVFGWILARPQVQREVD
jgi:hypothetical protein